MDGLVPKDRSGIPSRSAGVPLPRPSETGAYGEHKAQELGDLYYAADNWHGIKKHWTLELQRLIRARRAAGITS